MNTQWKVRLLSYTKSGGKSEEFDLLKVSQDNLCALGLAKQTPTDAQRLKEALNRIGSAVKNLEKAVEGTLEFSHYGGNSEMVKLKSSGS